jgi:hypothetical protein
MQQAIRRTVTSAVAISLTFCATSCSYTGSGAHSKSRRAGNPAEVASPLTTQAVRPELLAGINSLEITQPSVTSSTGTVAIEPSDAQRMIEQVARETMTLKIVSQAGATSTTKRLAKGATTDAVLHTDLLRFEQRQGSAIGGEPAVISFRMSMRTVPAGVEVWSAQYFLRQEALSENLLRINERVGKDGLGAGWRSAGDVFKKGVSLALQDFSSQRERRFLVSSR